MKLLDLILTVATIVSGILCVILWDSMRAPGQAATIVTSEPSHIELGHVKQTAAIPFEFVLFNNGSREVVVTEVNRPCSCTNIELPVSTRIPAGGRHRVKGSLQTIGRRGLYAPNFAISFKELSGQLDTLLIPLSSGFAVLEQVP
jgi:hypothetical protein